MFDPEMYTISVKKEVIDGETYYVARVLELKDVEEYGDSTVEAYALAIDTIVTSHEMFQEQGLSFPEPQSIDDRDNVSGRVTLRLPKSMHVKLNQEVKLEGVSLNTLIINIISEALGGRGLISNLNTSLKCLIDSLEPLNSSPAIFGWRTVSNSFKHIDVNNDIFNYTSRANINAVRHISQKNIDVASHNVIREKQVGSTSMQFVSAFQHVKAGRM